MQYLHVSYSHQVDEVSLVKLFEKEMKYAKEEKSLGGISPVTYHTLRVSVDLPTGHVKRAKTTFIKTIHFHQKPLSSETTYITNPTEGAQDNTRLGAKNKRVRISVKASPAEGRRCST